MDDLIYRWEAIDAMTAENLSWNLDSVHDDDIKRAARAAQRALARLPAAQQWIPVNEKLPKEERNIYWVYTDFGSMHECRWTNNRFGLGESDTWGWSIFDVPQHSKVTHWRELPEPPKEEA